MKKIDPRKVAYKQFDDPIEIGRRKQQIVNTMEA